MKKTIFVVEDDKNINLLITETLRQDGFEIKNFYNGIQMLEEFEQSKAHLIILDLILPEMDGLEIMKKVKKISSVPVIILTSKGNEIDRILGLELGADDYIVKPFSIRELIARVKAVLRRSEITENVQESVIALGDFVFNLDSKEVTFKGEPLEFTKTETTLIEYFMKNKNKLLTKENLITHVWGYDKDIQTRTVDVHVGNIRKKFHRYKDIPFTVVTVHSLGYKLVTK